MIETILYRVHGLDCMEEVAILKKEVGGRTGVVALDFDVINARMSVQYESGQVSPSDIVATVATTGMTAVPWTDRARANPLPFWQAQGRLIMTVISGLCLAAGLAVHWLLHGLYDAFAAGHGDPHAFPLVSAALYVSAVVAGAWFVAPKALLAVRRLRPDMNLLMVVAIGGALAIGDWFEAATVAFLFAVSLFLEQWSVGRARRAISALLSISPPTARCLDPVTGHFAVKPVAEIPVGTTVYIRPGERMPLDGVILNGTSSLNQAPITGESMPVTKKPGDEVFAGTINEEGALEIQVTKPASDTVLARIIHMVEQAQTRRAPVQQWVDQFALYYTPAMMLFALAVAMVPPILFSGDWIHWLYQGLVVLVIACPCALVISTPVAIVAALTSAAHNGVLIKGGLYIEMVGQLRAIALDKTGTLTRGHPEVQRILPFSGHTANEVLQHAAAMEADSEHPLARAILRKAQSEGLSVVRGEDFRAIKGKGAEAHINGKPYWIGSHRLMDEKGQETPDVHARAEELEDAGHTVVAIGNDRHVCGLIGIADSLRADAADAVAALKGLGFVRVVMLTGDNEGTAKAVAHAAGVDQYMAELLPEDKVAAIESLAKDIGPVAMVGDGINDAPAMAAATFGIAMGAMGTDAAIETADIALMSDDLSKLPWLVRHSRRTRRVIQANMAFALGIKALFMILALSGLATLWMAIAADMGASLLVVFNALRLLNGQTNQTDMGLFGRLQN